MRMYFKNGEFRDLYNTDDDHLLQNLEEIIQEQLGDEVVEMLHNLIGSINKEVQDDLRYVCEPLYELSALCDYVRGEVEMSKKLSRQTLLDQIHDVKLLGSKAIGMSDDMSQEEQSVIDEFQGKESYNNILQHKDKYLFNSSSLLKLETSL